MSRMKKIGTNTKKVNMKVKDPYAAGVEKLGFIPILPPRNITSKYKTVRITTAISQNEVRIASISRIVKRHMRNKI